ncbi:hypothetical protein ACH19I_03090 [Yersinia kristensenii]|uniref:hypothetical protein n=1 Tax=Yersinia kristensenii TaxID=28152 RepID=UPI003896BEAF
MNPLLLLVKAVVLGTYSEAVPALVYLTSGVIVSYRHYQTYPRSHANTTIG